MTNGAGRRLPVAIGGGTRGSTVRGPLNATPRLVNSQLYTTSQGYTRAMIATEQKSAGTITFDPSINTGVGTAPGQDVNGNPMTGSAVLVDYNYILTCAHCVDSVFLGAGPAAMASGKVWVQFNNEFTAASADTATKVMEPSRPFANFRADLEVWGGTSCDLDYALVKIEWPPTSSISLVGHMPTLPDPGTFSASALKGKSALFIGQYTHDTSVSPPKTVMSTHCAMSVVTNTGVSKTWDGCGSASPPAYGEFTLGVGVPGPSGSGVYDLVNGQVRLVGIFGNGFGSMRYFVTLDQMYADTSTGKGSTKPSGTIKDLLGRILAQRWKDGMPKI
jgi:hypothetical protein